MVEQASETSLDRVGSPEQLDELMTITRPTGWIAAIMLWGLLAVAIVWGIFGRVPQKVSGRGIIIRAGGIFDVVSLGTGQVEQILVRPDQQVAKGQVVARIRQPLLELQLQEARENLDRLLKGDSSRKEMIGQAQQTVRDLEDSLDQTSLVRSSLSGIVVEVRTAPGLLVSPGASMLSVEREDAPILSVIYINADDGKKIQPGMRIQISPSTVKKELDGFMLGTVETVSSFPASVEGMMALLQNQQLVQELTTGGPPIAVFARPLADPKTPSGFRWSSGRGPDIRITAGTPCTASVVVEEYAPISLVIPAFREKLGL